MNPVVAADKWLYRTLAADETLQVLVSYRVYAHIVPEGGSYPLVLITLPSPGTNLTTLEGNFVWSDMLYAVRLVDTVQNYSALEAGAYAIQQILNKGKGENESGQILSSIYESPFAMMEIDRDGFEVRHLGGIYRLHVK